MPPRKEIIAKIRKAAKSKGIEFTELRQGGNHTIFDLDGDRIPIGRHRQFDERYTRMVYEECQNKLGKGWWK
ncbi:hypothetical protein [Mycolicibacterium fallax]|uniref:Toxin HicA n=1 Tax=Mycolicibacterium fallax TaxID=1793 RepID=A0A1X1RK47_MYCFA|nr:hypothetical protein [Mycolicibacterium fallax]ORV08047.1 hypothetical protein AWC04_02580 [Mycolicibacterium fallax]